MLSTFSPRHVAFLMLNCGKHGPCSPLSNIKKATCTGNDAACAHANKSFSTFIVNCPVATHITWKFTYEFFIFNLKNVPVQYWQKWSILRMSSPWRRFDFSLIFSLHYCLSTRSGNNRHYYLKNNKAMDCTEKFL